MGVHADYDKNSNSEVTASSNITDNAVARGDGGAKGIQGSGVILDDSDNLTGINSITGLGTDLAVAEGGTGASTLTDHGLLVGSGTDPVTALAAASDGQVFIGATGADPAPASLSSADGSLTYTAGANTLGAAVSDRVRMQGVYYENIGISYSAGTFTVNSADGTSFSASNPGIVVLPSKATPGAFTKYSITADQSFIDDAGASEIIGNLFSLPTGVAFSNDIPFFIYAVTNDDEDTIQFMITRVPHATSSPAVASIGAPDDPVADTQGAFFSFDNIDETLYDTNPCACIGSFRMRMSASDDWTVQTLNNSDGIGQFQENVTFNLTATNFGTGSSTLILPNGGTSPTFTTIAFEYFVSKNGQVDCLWSLNGDAGTAGAGAVSSFIAIPYISLGSQSPFCGNSRVLYAGSTYNNSFVRVAASNNYASFMSVSSGSNITNSLFTAGGNRDVTGSCTYKIGLT